jgi:uncharacterized protein YdeI (YjbR/CyaY-like superfamily)
MSLRNRLVKRGARFYPLGMKKAHADPRIDAKIAAAAPFAQPILKHLRALVHKACPEVVETIKWGMPSFTLNGEILCIVGDFKGHCAFVFWHKDMKAVLGAAGEKAESAMGSLGKITSLADLPGDAAMIRYLKKAAEFNASGSPARDRPKAKPKSADKVPAELVAALKKNRVAAATFDKISPSHRREYIEWISEAKREETKAKRVATTLEWLSEGKSRNWKYENC